jgi:hypothetical protein
MEVQEGMSAAVNGEKSHADAAGEDENEKPSTEEIGMSGSGSGGGDLSGGPKLFPPPIINHDKRFRNRPLTSEEHVFTHNAW